MPRDAVNTLNGTTMNAVSAAEPETPAVPTANGMRFTRHFCPETAPGVDPLDLIAWSTRVAEIKDGKGNVVFRQEGVEAPAFWSQLAVNIVASKYFYGRQGTARREYSVRQLVDRVANTISRWAGGDRVFAGSAAEENFRNELRWMLAHQYGSFNSPVWFNVGIFQEYGVSAGANGYRWDRETSTVVPCEDRFKYPQASACFIQSVDDDMGSIMDLAKSEAMLFKGGSGTGSDLSTLRSTKERLAVGGRPSGPVSFLRIYDKVGGQIKSGGAVRRAARMNTLKDWHPDIVEFIRCKAKEDAKARALIAAGYSSGMTGSPDEAYSSVDFQNTNVSVRASHAFMAEAEAGLTSPWTTHAVTSDETFDSGFTASQVMDEIAQGTWLCGDPGMQFHDTINRWHTIPNESPIESSNPCSEYLHINDSACNLASLNLMRFRNPDGTFDHEGFRSAVRVFITAMDTLVSHASYPTAKVAANSYRFRPLGLGYANLGSLVMANGLSYDGDESRHLAAAVTAVMQAQAARTSAEIAGRVGCFDGFPANREPMLRVVDMHWDAARDLLREMEGKSDARWLTRIALEDFMEAKKAGELHGFRNSQFSVLAPTGTIGLQMDCDTTGVEPSLALVQYKSLAGGGNLRMVNQVVPVALKTLGYDDEQIASLGRHIENDGTLETHGGVRHAHLPVFDCAFPQVKGGRAIHWRGHLKMMAAVQPFLSGAISKTVNMPGDATPAEIRQAYVEGWKLGLKAVAVYRDGSKGVQPLNTKAAPDEKAAAPPSPPQAPRRVRLPHTRDSVTHHFNIAGRHDGYVTVGLYPDGSPGELFVKMSREGSTLAGLMDSWATMVSIGLQYGVPIEVFVNKFKFVRFEPSGFTGHPDVPLAKSIVDYVARWAGCRFIPGFRLEHAPHELEPVPAATAEARSDFDETPVSRPPRGRTSSHDDQARSFQSDSPPCDNCGSLTVRRGACYVCPNCGSNSGCG